MAEEDIAKQIEERLAQLPDDIRDAILASDFDQKVQNIGRAHNLHIDQSQLLGNEIYMLMLGMGDTKDFADNVVKEVHVSKEEADKIAADVNAKILAPIRESMKRTYEDAPATASTAPAASTKSVVMPSSIAAAPKPPMPPAAAVPPAPVKPACPLHMSVPPPAMPMSPIRTVPPPDMHAAEVVLKEKTLQVPAPPAGAAPTTPPPPKPQAYKADPYREPIE
jgi:hypothetical protein